MIAMLTLAMLPAEAPPPPAAPQAVRDGPIVGDGTVFDTVGRPCAP